MKFSAIPFLTLVMLLAIACAPDDAAISLSVGPTEIPRGDAMGENDITVNNGLFAVAFAVDTAPPWGVARGGIVDIAIIRDGKTGYDIASLADFMPNNWSSWPTTYQHVAVETQTSDEVVIRTERDFADVELTTRFHIRAADSKIRIVTNMTNKADTALEGLLSGYVVWPDGGNLLATPISMHDGDSNNGWTAAYDENWLVGLHAPFAEVADRRGRDRYTNHDLGPGESVTFEAFLQIESAGSLAAMVQSEIAFGQLPSGQVEGRITTADGAAVRRPAVVVQRVGGSTIWAIGEGGQYAVSLPVGEYEMHATAAGYGASASQRVIVTEDSREDVNFDDVKQPGTINVQVRREGSGQPLDARIRIAEGQKPLIAYFGREVYFTELEDVGKLTTSMPPGEYVLEVSAGGGFLTRPQHVNVVVESGSTQPLEIDIPFLADPGEAGWFSADLHHHSDVLDGFTEAEFVLRSELAAGVDIAFLSDHDSVVNNDEMRRLARTRDVPFIPATELSPSWGHFNAYPLDDGKDIRVDTSLAPVQEIFEEARRLGADVIAVNHPYSEYGYFTSHDSGSVPGGYDAGFDFLEIAPVLQSSGQPNRNRETIERAWQMWNEGQRIYVVGGSDVHDVWNFRSARARTYAYIEGELTVPEFIAAIRAGRSYASQGPLVDPEIMFGTDLSHGEQSPLRLAYSVQAVSGLKSVTLIERGELIDTQKFAGETHARPVAFPVKPRDETWYSLVVEDREGKFAYTNPVWVNAEE